MGIGKTKRKPLKTTIGWRANKAQTDWLESLKDKAMEKNKDLNITKSDILKAAFLKGMPDILKELGCDSLISELDKMFA